MLVSEKFLNKSIREITYPEYQKNFWRRVSEKAFMLVSEKFFKKSIRENICMLVSEKFFKKSIRESTAC